jgi:hypothetical protein
LVAFGVWWICVLMYRGQRHFRMFAQAMSYLNLLSRSDL